MTTSELSAAKTAVFRGVPAGGRVLCAVSGGLDSMCLLHLMATWGRAQGFTVIAAHFNHHLRPTAGRDAQFVRDWCAAHRIPCVCGEGDVAALAVREGLSTEEAARKARYAFLQKSAEREGCGMVLTAHHADDNAETMLLNLIRGTGIRGLAGIPAERDGILRPFLEIPREELAAYAAAHEIPHVEDETNADPDAAARNLLRLKVMPVLKELNPRAVEHMSAASVILRAADSAMEEDARRYLSRADAQPGRVRLALDELARAPESVLPRVLLGLFDLLGVGRKDVGRAHLASLRQLLDNPDGESRVSLPHGVTGRVAQGRLILETLPQPPGRAQLAEGVPLYWGDWRLTLLSRREGEGLALGSGAKDCAVCVSPACPGERLTLPDTNGGGRTVKRLCLDRGISPEERDRLPAFYASGRLAAVWPLGVNAEFVPEGEPCRFIKIIKIQEENGYEK